MSVIPIRCAGCRKVLHVTKTSSLFDLRQRELHAKNRGYEAATTHAETHLLNLINAVEQVRNVEHKLTDLASANMNQIKVSLDDHLECHNCHEQIPYGQTVTVHKDEPGAYKTFCKTCSTTKDGAANDNC